MPRQLRYCIFYVIMHLDFFVDALNLCFFCFVLSRFVGFPARFSRGRSCCAGGYFSFRRDMRAVELSQRRLSSALAACREGLVTCHSVSFELELQQDRLIDVSLDLSWTGRRAIPQN